MDKIKKIIENYCLKEVEDEEELLKSDLLNSFQLLEVICELEDVYQVELSPEDIEDMDNFSSVKNIRNLIDRKSQTGKERLGNDCAGDIRPLP